MAVDSSGERSVTASSEQATLTLGRAIAIAQGYHQQGRFSTAEEIYLQILSQKPDQPEVLNFLGVLRFQLGLPDQGIQLILASLKINPGYVDALNNLGNILRKQNQIEDAEKAYRRAIEISPDFPEAHMNLSALLYKADRFEDAIVEASRAAQLSPQMFESDAIAVNSIEINSMASIGDIEGATKSYLQAIERKLFDPSLHENLARVLWMLDRRDEAIETYRRWIEMEPDNPRPRHHLAACTGVDVPARASESYVKAVFNRFALSFDSQLAKLQYAGPSLVVDAMKEEFGVPESKLTILDAGCGTGLCGTGIRPFARLLMGVDLSSKMLEKARERDVYDELHEAELTEFLSRSPQIFDAIISADTLIYFGDLFEPLAAAAAALRLNGRFVFTVEKAPSSVPDGYCIQGHGRYQHSEQYLRSVIERAVLEPVVIREVFVRTENNEPVNGWLAVVKPKLPPRIGLTS